MELAVFHFRSVHRRHQLHRHRTKDGPALIFHAVILFCLNMFLTFAATFAGSSSSSSSNNNINNSSSKSAPSSSEIDVPSFHSKTKYLARGMLGKVTCPLESDPPNVVIVWSKNDKAFDLDGSTRIKLNRRGTLIFRWALETDEGHYLCQSYSPFGTGGLKSSSVEVLIRGMLYDERCCMMHVVV